MANFSYLFIFKKGLIISKYSFEETYYFQLEHEPLFSIHENEIPTISVSNESKPSVSVSNATIFCINSFLTKYSNS